MTAGKLPAAYSSVAGLAVAMLLRAGLLVLSLLSGDAFAQNPQFKEIASGVYVAIADSAENSPENRGFTSNLAFVVGARGVTVIGSGPGEAGGRAIIAAVRRVTDRPIVLLINQYGAPEHVLGNAAFSRRGVPILAQRETLRFMQANCSTCVRNLRRQVGARELGRVKLVMPDRIVESGQRLTSGGREFELLYPGPSFQAGALMVRDVTSGVLFAGEVVSLGRIPDTRNADILGWLRALDALRAEPDVMVVPAHGPVSAAAQAGEPAKYLRLLTERVTRAYDDGVPMQEAARVAPVPEFAHWALYATMHPRNVHFAFLRAENADLSR